MSRHKINDKIELHGSGDVLIIKGVIDKSTYFCVDMQGKERIVSRSEIRALDIEPEYGRVRKEPKPRTDSRFINLVEKKGEEELYLAFEYGMSGDEDGFTPYLVNKSGTAYLIEITISQGKYHLIEDTENMRAYHAMKLDFLPSSTFSIPTKAKLKIEQFYTDGSVEKQMVKTSIRSRDLQSMPELDPCLNRKVVKKQLQSLSVQSVDELKKYTENLKKEKPSETDRVQVDIYNPAVTASFETVKDLHFDQLVANPDEYEAAEALKIQLDTYNEFINASYQLGFSSVVVIHGKGKGRLRREIEKSCERDSRIQGCAPAYAKGYDGGSTEIFFL